MEKKLLQSEIHDMSEKIFELQAKTEHLTNGQRYAAINEINKCMQPLRNDLRHLERELYIKQSQDEHTQEDMRELEKQINELENLKSDLITRINTETEHTRQELNDKIIEFLARELKPIKQSIENNQKEIQNIKDDITSLRFEIKEHEKNQEIKEVARFDRFKVIITAVVAVLSATSILSLWLEPSIRTLISVFW